MSVGCDNLKSSVQPTLINFCQWCIVPIRIYEGYIILITYQCSDPVKCVVLSFDLLNRHVNVASDELRTLDKHSYDKWVNSFLKLNSLTYLLCCDELKEILSLKYSCINQNSATQFAQRGI